MGRVLAAAAVVALVTGGRAADKRADFPDPNVREVLTRSQQAVGSIDAVASLHSLLLTGVSRITARQGLIECDLEIRILLPDRYLRIDRASFGEKRAGFHGRDPLSVITERGRTTLPPEALKTEIVDSERERMVQLLLGAAAYISPKDIVWVRSTGGTISTAQPQPTAEQGSQRNRTDDGVTSSARTPRNAPAWSETSPDLHALDVSVRQGARFRFTTDQRTALPARVSYRNTSGDEVTMTFGERRPTSGLNLPYRITTTSKGRIIDDLLLDAIVVNADLDAATFAR